MSRWLPHTARRNRQRATFRAVLANAPLALILRAGDAGSPTATDHNDVLGQAIAQGC